MILVTGPTGNVGSRLVRHLAGAGVPTRAFVHRQESVSELQELGVETAVGAFEDSDSLRRAMEGIEQVYLVSPPGSASLVAQQLPVVEAARKAGVRHVVKQSSIAAEEDSPPPIVAAHRQVEQAMEDSGMAWTHLRPHWFMQNELGQAATIAGDGVFYAPDVTQISMIDAADVASVAAAVLTSDGHAGQAYLLTGPEALTYADVADTYARVLGKDVRWQEVSLEDARDSMRGAGMDDELAVGFPEIMHRYRAGGSARSLSPWVERLTGRPPRTFEDFVREHRDTFSGG